MSERRCAPADAQKRGLPASAWQRADMALDVAGGAVEWRAQRLPDVTRICNTMDDHQRLLEEAREFCDPVTGEVINRIPDELMRRLREAKLARGIHGVPSKRTVAGATWFVFLNAEIRDRVLSERRVEAASRKKRSGSGEQNGLTHSLPETPAASGIPCQRGLKAFRQRRTTNDGE